MSEYKTFNEVDRERETRREATEEEEEIAERIGADFGDAMQSARLIKPSMVKEVDDETLERKGEMADVGRETFDTQADQVESIRQDEVNMAEEMGEAQNQHAGEAEQLRGVAGGIETPEIARGLEDIASEQEEAGDRFSEMKEGIEGDVEASRERIARLESEVEQEAMNLPF